MGTFANSRKTWWSCMVMVAALTMVSSAAGRTDGAQLHRTAADTTLPTWQNLYDWANGHGYVGWHANTSSAADYGLESNLGGNYGLWLWARGGQHVYTQDDFAEWTYTAPGTTRLLHTTLSFSYRNKLLSHHCIDIGFRTLSGVVVTRQEFCQPAHPPDSQDLTNVRLEDPSANPTSKVLYLRIHVDCGGATTCAKTIPALDPLATAGFVRFLKVDMTLVDEDNPTLEPSGPLYDIRNTYINGTRTYGVTVHADDAGSGVTKAWLERQGFQTPTGTLSIENAPCDPAHHTPPLDARICPASFEYLTSVDSNTLAEGTSHFYEDAQDVAGNFGASPEWHFYIDRTPPSVPSGLRLESFRASSGSASIAWDESTDPALPDGVPGSGLDHYQARYQLNGGNWSQWSDETGPTLIVDGGSSGDTLTVEARSVDAVDNVSAAAAASFTLVDNEPVLTPGESGDADTVATSDPRVEDIIAGRSYSIQDTTPWTTRDGRPIGAQVTLSWATPTTIAYDWPSTEVVAHYTAANVTGLSILVDLNCNQVVSIDPDEDAYATDTPTYVSEPTSSSCASLTFTSMGASAAASTSAAWVHNVIPIHVGPDYFWNYDFTQPSFDASIDWPIGLVFWNSALTPDQVKLYDFGQSIAVAAYLNIAQGHGPNFWDSDHGSKSGIPGCNTVVHYRVYKDDTASDARFTTNWGFYIVSSAHYDRFEECKVPTPFGFKNVGDHWSGRSERAEGKVADAAASRWGSNAIQRDAVELYNEETAHREGDHRYENDGKATKIKVCIDRLGNNTICP